MKETHGRLWLGLVLACALPGVLFGVVSALDWLVFRAIGRYFTSSSFFGGIAGLLAFLAGVCSPVSTACGLVLAVRVMRSARRLERLGVIVVLGMASIATTYFLTAYILPIVVTTLS